MTESELLYTAYLVHDAFAITLYVTVNGEDIDFHLGDPGDADAETWDKIGRLWTVAPKMAAFLKRLQVRLEALPMDAMGTTGIPDFIGDNTVVTMMYVRDSVLSEINSLLKETE